MKFPANSAIFIELINTIVSLDLIPTESVDEKIYELPEDDPFNVNFEAMGIESKILVGNMGLLLWLIWLYAFIAVIALILCKVKPVWEKFGQFIYWNTLIRFYMESYEAVTLLSMLNLSQVDWD